VTLTIKDVVLRNLTIDFKSGKKGDCWCLEFEEDPRLLEIKSKSHGPKLVKLLGDNMDAWPGQCITLGGIDYTVGRGVAIYAAQGRPRYTEALEPAGNMAADPGGEQEDLEYYEGDQPQGEVYDGQATGDYYDEEQPPPPRPRGPPARPQARPQQPPPRRPQPPPQRPPQRR
jgi:hypothetical protein